MSPLIGSIGAVSEYSYRGNLDDYPNPFSFTDIEDTTPGTAYTTGITTITGINYKAKISISGFGSFSVNGGAFTTSTSFIRNNDIISIRIPTTSGTIDDFSKLYSSRLTIGKVSSSWNVITRIADQTPTPFAFTSVAGMEVGIVTTSNSATLASLESGVLISAQVTSGIGSFRINGGIPVYSGGVTNGDVIDIVSSSPISYSSTEVTEVRVGSFLTTFSVSTRVADITPNAFSFTPQTNVNLSTAVESNTITISGCDANVPLTVSITGGNGTFRVVRGGVTIRDYSPFSYGLAQNGDQITVRLTSSSSGSTSTSTTLNVSGVSATFTVTTRIPAYNTIPNQFTFTDLTNQPLNTWVVSQRVRLTGMTPGFFGSARVSGVYGGDFRVERGGVIIRDFSSGQPSTPVQNGDDITLTIDTGRNEASEVNMLFIVEGENTFNVPSISGRTEDRWNVGTRGALCNPSSSNYNLSIVRNAELSTTYNQTFSLSDVDPSCTGFTISVSSSNAYLIVDGVRGNNLTARYGSSIGVYMTSSSSYSTQVSTGFTIRRSGLVVVSQTWVVETKAAPPNCNPNGSNYNVLNVTNANLNTVYSQSFRLSDVDSSCSGYSVSVSSSGSGSVSLTVDGVSGNNLPARPGSNITVSTRSSSSFDSVVYGQLIISRGGVAQVNQGWFVETRAS